ncbi:BH3810 [Halalkalibacterium halodurans C-125]|nr:BH3810 [Halalkalibacterium halodurans C-125]
MRFDEAYSGKVFIMSRSNYEKSKAVIFGMPMDWTVSFRPARVSVQTVSVKLLSG